MKNSTNQFKGVPEQYLDMFKAGISAINAGMYFEETLRNQIGKIRIARKALRFTDGQVKMVDVSQYLIQQGEKAITHLKKYNEAVNQIFINPKGEEEIQELGYTLAGVFDQISYLSIADQEKVAQFVRQLTEQSNQTTNINLNKAI